MKGDGEAPWTPRRLVRMGLWCQTCPIRMQVCTDSSHLLETNGWGSNDNEKFTVRGRTVLLCRCGAREEAHPCARKHRAMVSATSTSTTSVADCSVAVGTSPSCRWLASTSSPAGHLVSRPCYPHYRPSSLPFLLNSLPPAPVRHSWHPLRRQPPARDDKGMLWHTAAKSNEEGSDP